MNDEVNYAAIGRYVHAKEQVAQLADQRIALCRKLQESVSLVELRNAGQRVDTDRLAALVDQIAAADAELARALAEMNESAGPAGRKPYKPTYL